MAISKTQPMRPAEIDLIDAVNSHEQTLNLHTQSLNTLVQNLATEIGDREAADTALGERISNIENEIGTGFDSQNTITAYTQALDLFLGTRTNLDDTVVNSILTLAASSETLESFVSRFKIGLINNLFIPANDSLSTSATFTEPFDSTDSCVLFAQVITDELASLFTYTLIDCTYSGFSYSIANSDADAHTVSLGYIAVKVN